MRSIDDLDLHVTSLDSHVCSIAEAEYSGSGKGGKRASVSSLTEGQEVRSGHMSQAVLKGGKSGAELSIFGEKAKRPANLRNRRRVAKPNKIDMQGGPKVRALKQKDVVMSSGKVNLSDAIPAMSLVQKSISTATCGQMRVFLRESDVLAQSL